jgi:RHS repeat-associated protein
MNTLRHLAVGLGLLGAGLLQVAQAAPPATKLITVATPVAPANAWSYYGTSTTRTNTSAAWNTAAPELALLARSLGANRVSSTTPQPAGTMSPAQYTQNVFDYVRNGIETEFRFGLGKGARGALIDQSGTSFDQAELMVKLLRAGGVTAGYRVGTITLSPAQFGAWTGLVNGLDESLQTFSVNGPAACQFLADGGIPFTINGGSTCSGLSGNLTSTATIVMGHAWVAVGTTLYDPAFKSNRLDSGIDIAAGMQCGTMTSPTCGEGIRSQMMSGITPDTFAGVPSINEPNRTALASRLRTYAINLENNIKANSPGAELVDIVGGLERDTAYSPTAGTSLPYASSAQYSWSGEIPNQFRTTMRVRIGTYDFTFYADEIAARRVRLMSWEEFFIDHTLVPSTGCPSGCIANTAVIDLNHPYAATAGGVAGAFADTHGEFLMVDLAEGSSSDRGTPPVTIVHTFGNGSPSTERYVSDLQSADPYVGATGTCGGNVGGIQPPDTPPADGYLDLTGCENQSQPTLMARLLSQGSRADKIVEGVTRANINRHHNIGIIYARVWGVASLSFLNVQSSLSIASRTNVATGRTAAFEGASAMWAMLEGSQNQQMTDNYRALGVATDFMFRGGRFLDVAPGSMSTVLSSLTTESPNFWRPDRRSRLLDAAANGYSTIMTTVAPGSGGSLFYTSTNSSYAVYEGAKGGAALGQADPWAIPLKTVDDEPPSWFQANKSSVSLANGELTLTPPADLVTGVGDFPSSLAFQRTYRSGGVVERLIGHSVHHWWPGNPDDPPIPFSSARDYVAPDTDYSSRIGGAWTHNWEVLARYSNDAAQALGADSGLDAASVIAGVMALTDAAKTASFQNRLATIFGSAWVSSRLMYNQVTINNGSNSESFHRLMDLSFNPPQGSGSRLLQTGEMVDNTRDYNAITFRYIRGGGDEMTFDVAGRVWTGAAWGNAAPLFKAGTWTFPDGIKVTFGYQYFNQNFPLPWPANSFARNTRHVLASVSNNLGRRLNFNSEVVIIPIGSSQGGYTIGGFVLKSVTDENGRAVGFNHTGCGTSNLWTCSTLTVTSPTSAVSKYEYAANAASPDPAFAWRPNYVLRRWFSPSDQTNPYNTVRYDEFLRVQTLTDVSGRVTSFYPGSLVGTEAWKRGEKIDAANQSTATVHDDAGNPIISIDGLGRITKQSYDDQNRLVLTINPEGDRVIRTYDVRSNPLTVTKRAKAGSGLADVVEESNTYVEGPAVRDCSNQKTCNRVATRTNPLGGVSSLAYSPTTGQALTMTAPTVPLGAGTGTPRTTWCYTSFSTSNGAVSLLTGKIERVNATATRVTSMGYNTSNKYVLASQTADPSTTLTPPSTPALTCPTSTKSGALNLVTAYTFDAVGNVASINGPRTDVTDVTNYRFDTMRRLTRVDAPLNSIQRYTYDIDGQRRTLRKAIVATPTDANPSNPSPTDLVASHWSTETRVYWPTGTLRSKQDPQGNLTQYTYDNVDRLVLTLDPDNRGAGTVYDAAGQTACTWKGLGASAPSTCSWSPATYVSQGNAGPLRYAHYAYTLNGKQRMVQDSGDNITEYVFDGLDRVAFTLFPHPTTGNRCTVATPVTSTSTPSCADGTSQTYEKNTYDAAGNRLTLRTRKADTITWTYDTLSRMRTKAVSGTPALGLVTFDFNLKNEQISVSSPASGSIPAHSTSYDYDAAGRRQFEDNFINGTTRRVAYQYNGPLRSRTTWPDGYFVHYAYDAKNRMQYARENSTTANELAFYQYDQLSRRNNLRYAGVATNTIGYTYEPDGNLDVLTNVLNTATVTLDYGYNNSGQARTIVANDDFFLPPPATSVSTAYTPDKLNRYGAVGADPVPTYDLNGNLLTWGPTATRSTYTYDAENRLRTAAVGGGSSSAYDYDALGRRLSKTVGATSTYYLLDGDEEIAEYSSSGTVLRRYITGTAIDDRIATTEDGAVSNPVKTYYHVNHQGSVIAMTNSAGSATGCSTNCQRMSYDEYGNLGAGSVATGQPFRYTGRRFDAESGLYYYRARYYTPVLGRFLSVDPIGYKDDVNLYAYVYNDPTNRTDPTGKCGPQGGGGAMAIFDCDPNKARAMVAAAQRAQQTGEQRAMAPTHRDTAGGVQKTAGFVGSTADQAGIGAGVGTMLSPNVAEVTKDVAKFGKEVLGPIDKLADGAEIVAHAAKGETREAAGKSVNAGASGLAAVAGFMVAGPVGALIAGGVVGIASDKFEVGQSFVDWAGSLKTDEDTSKMTSYIPYEPY